LTLQVSEESIESSNSFVHHKKDLEEASKINLKILIMNCIYKINRYKLLLFIIFKITALNISFYIVFIFMLHEIADDYI